MKKGLLKFTFIITLLSGFLVGCDKANFRFINGKEGLWGNDDYRFNEEGMVSFVIEVQLAIPTAIFLKPSGRVIVLQGR